MPDATSQNPHDALPISLRCEAHPNGRLMHHVGAIDGIRVEAHQNEQAHNARAAGSWFLTVGVAGHPLRCHSQHRTLTDARAFAGAVIASAPANPTHAQLLAAVARIESGPNADVDLDAGVEQLETADSAGLAAEVANPIVVIPCGAQKLDAPAPAGQLYTSAHFRLALRAARRLAAEQAGRVLILSALHGLVGPSDVLAPYDVKMGDPTAIAPATIAEQLRRLNPTTITTLLPRAYAQALDEAVELNGGPDLIDLYAEAPGIGYQRGVAARLIAA